jgi:hypothetical protein
MHVTHHWERAQGYVSASGISSGFRSQIPDQVNVTGADEYRALD